MERTTASGARTGSTSSVARTYALIFGLTYLAVALIEIMIGSEGLAAGNFTILQFTGIQNAIHWIVGLVVLGSFFVGESAAKMTARIIGTVFVLLTVLGFVARDLTGEILGFDGPLPWSYNLVHLLTAAAALFAGFAYSGSYDSTKSSARTRTTA